jgi:hypothetical protein
MPENKIFKALQSEEKIQTWVTRLKMSPNLTNKFQKINKKPIKCIASPNSSSMNSNIKIKLLKSRCNRFKNNAAV